MSMISIVRMPFSRLAVWPDLFRQGSTTRHVFWALVLPMSVLPPAMLLLAGRYHQGFWPYVNDKPWALTAAVLFFVELLSVFFMGWLVRQVVHSFSLHDMGYSRAYTIAAVAPVPLWLSSVALAVDSFAFNTVVCAIAFCISCALIYQGIRAACSRQETVVTASATHVVIGAGLALWIMLLLWVVA